MLAGCAGVRLPASSKDPGTENEVPMEVDPGPASSRPLDEKFSILVGELKAHQWLRLLVDLRSQVDLTALGERHYRQGLGRREARERTLLALQEVADQGKRAIEPLLEVLFDEGLVEYYEPLRFRNMVYVSCRPEALERLQNAKPVARLIPEYDSVRSAKRRKAGSAIAKSPPIPPGDSWGVDFLDLKSLWEQGIDGRGTVVGILDSGIAADHDALAPSRRSERAWYDPKEGNPAPRDTAPHGTHVLSCAVGGEVDGHALGTAPGAKWTAALSNYFNSYNNVNMALAADWLLFEAQPDVLLGAWGHGKGRCDPRDRALVEAFRAAGVVPIFAAGNDGDDPASGQTPAALSGLFPDGGGPLSVAAIDRHGRVIDSSSRGPNPCAPDQPFPDISAPGWEVPVPGFPTKRSLTLSAGTSMSVGWVGGVAAMVLQVAPDMPVPDVEKLLRSTARDIGPEGHDPAAGYGILDAHAAVAAARRWAEKRP